MIPRIEIATAPVPGGGRLRLIRRGADFFIMLDGNELMSSRLSGSEEALATLAIDRFGTAAKPHLLIGGLGMGFTLRAALGRLGPTARITVAELVPAVVEWARGPLYDIFGGCLQDARVDIVEADVGDVIGTARSNYDAILLDVDNGPDGLTKGSNDRLYSSAGLSAARSALKLGGVLAVWSASPIPAFPAASAMPGLRWRYTRSVQDKARARATPSGFRPPFEIGAARPSLCSVSRALGLTNFGECVVVDAGVCEPVSMRAIPLVTGKRTGKFLEIRSFRHPKLQKSL